MRRSIFEHMEAASAIRFSVLRWRRSALLLDRFNLDEEEEDDDGLFFLPPLPLAGERRAAAVAGGFIIAFSFKQENGWGKMPACFLDDGPMTCI